MTFDLPWEVWAAVVWTAVSGTIYAFFLQSWAQRRTTSTHAAVLLCLESVFSAVFGIIFGMDTITWRLITGATLIFSGILIIEAWPARRDGAAGKGAARSSRGRLHGAGAHGSSTGGTMAKKPYEDVEIRGTSSTR